jgi:hypothetical protein
MMSFDIAPPRNDAPAQKKAAEADHTRIDFATGKIPGIKASPAIDETYVLMPGLLPCVLDVAIDSNVPSPLLVSPAGAGLRSARLLVNRGGAGHAHHFVL